MLFGTDAILVHDCRNEQTLKINTLEFSDTHYTKKLNAKEKEISDSTSSLLNNSPILNHNIKWVQYIGNDNFYVLMQYYILKAGKSTSSKTTLAQKYAMLKYSNEGRILDGYPIETNDTIEPIFQFFTVKNDSTIYLLTHNATDDIYKSVKTKDSLYHVTEFVLRNDIFIHNRKIEYSMPKIYREKLIFNNYALNFSYYPLVSYYNNPDIFNIETSALTIYENNPKDDFSLQFARMKEDNELLVSYKNNGKNYIKNYDKNNKMQKVLVFEDFLSNTFFSKSAINLIRYQLIENSIEIVNMDNQRNKFPLELFLH